MNKYVLIGLVMLGLFVTGILGTGLWVFSTWKSTNNTAVALEAQFAAKQVAVGLTYDNMWKVIQEQAGVADQYKDTFSKVFPEIMQGRYSKGGEMFKFVQESNPNFDVSLYSNLQQSIESQRASSLREQKDLLDIKREHDALRGTFPSSLFMGGRPILVAKTITSTRTNKALETGEDNETLYKK